MRAGTKAGTASPTARGRHVNLGITSVYLDGIDTAEIIDTVHN